MLYSRMCVFASLCLCLCLGWTPTKAEAGDNDLVRVSTDKYQAEVYKGLVSVGVGRVSFLRGFIELHVRMGRQDRILKATKVETTTRREGGNTVVVCRRCGDKPVPFEIESKAVFSAAKLSVRTRFKIREIQHAGISGLSAYPGICRTGKGIRQFFGARFEGTDVFGRRFEGTLPEEGEFRAPHVLVVADKIDSIKLHMQSGVIEYHFRFGRMRWKGFAVHGHSKDRPSERKLIFVLGLAGVDLALADYEDTLDFQMSFDAVGTHGTSAREKRKKRATVVGPRPTTNAYALENGFVRDILLCGPFPAWGKGAMTRDVLSGEKELESREGLAYPSKVPFAATRTVSWKEFHMPRRYCSHWRTTAFSLNDIIVPSHYVLAYAFCYLESESEQGGYVEVPTYRRHRLWLNHRYIGSSARQHKYPVALRAGLNPLLIKVDYELWGWRFNVRVIDESGRPLHGVRVGLPRISRTEAVPFKPRAPHVPRPELKRLGLERYSHNRSRWWDDDTADDFVWAMRLSFVVRNALPQERLNEPVVIPLSSLFHQAELKGVRSICVVNPTGKSSHRREVNGSEVPSQVDEIDEKKGISIGDELCFSLCAPPESLVPLYIYCASAARPKTWRGPVKVTRAADELKISNGFVTAVVDPQTVQLEALRIGDVPLLAGPIVLSIWNNDWECLGEISPNPAALRLSEGPVRVVVAGRHHGKGMTAIPKVSVFANGEVWVGARVEFSAPVELRYPLVLAHFNPEPFDTYEEVLSGQPGVWNLRDKRRGQYWQAMDWRMERPDLLHFFKRGDPRGLLILPVDGEGYKWGTHVVGRAPDGSYEVEVCGEKKEIRINPQTGAWMEQRAHRKGRWLCPNLVLLPYQRWPGRYSVIAAKRTPLTVLSSKDLTALKQRWADFLDRTAETLQRVHAVRQAKRAVRHAASRVRNLESVHFDLSSLSGVARAVRDAKSSIVEHLIAKYEQQLGSAKRVHCRILSGELLFHRARQRLRIAQRAQQLAPERHVWDKTGFYHSLSWQEHFFRGISLLCDAIETLQVAQRNNIAPLPGTGQREMFFLGLIGSGPDQLLRVERGLEFERLLCDYGIDGLMLHTSIYHWASVEPEDDKFNFSTVD